jgi:hypothetical protein
MIGKIERFDAVVSLVGGTLNQKADGIIYYVDGQTPPSDEEIDAEVIRLQAEYDANQYQRDRQYPSIGDQLDMQYHDQIDGTTTWKDAIAKVKSDNPKE